MNAIHRMSGWALAGWLLAASAAWAGELVVFEAQGVDLTPGQSVDGARPLRLEAGQRLTLISESGYVLRLSGPYFQAPQPDAKSQDGKGLAQALKSLVVPFHVSTGGLGGTREADPYLVGAQTQSRLPEPWIIDVGHGGNYCLREGQSAVFWRSNGQEGAPITLRDANGEWTARTLWPRGSEKLASPRTMPYRDGGRYGVVVDGMENAFTLHIIPQTVTATGALAAWMHEKSCASQTLALLHGVE